MIKLKEIYDKSGRVDFQCDHCEQDFTDYNLRLSVFLHGAVFLTGEEKCCFGFTCPSCIKTVLVEGKDIERIKQLLSVFYWGNRGQYKPVDLRYHSSVIFSPNQIEYLSAFTIRYQNFLMSDDSIEKFHYGLAAYIEGNESIEQDYLCSYVYGSEPPIGYTASIWWFKPEDVKPLLQIENEHHVRVFPRNFHKMSWYETYDEFCWKYTLHLNYLSWMKNLASNNYDQLREAAYRGNINIDKLIEANPGTTGIETLEFMEQKAKQIIENDILVGSDFLDLLVNFNPSPWDLPDSGSDLYKGVWKTVSPFANIDVPSDFGELDPERFNPDISDIEVEELSDKVRTHNTKTHVQEWAVENHQKFIEEYISIASRPDFSYGLVWDLKCRYLRKVHDILEKGSIKESKYAMYQTGPTWTIIFNRKEITGLRQTGHKYIHYLLQHPNRTFPTKEMEGFVSSRPSREDFEEMTGSGSLQKKRGKLSKEKEDNYIKQMEELKEYREILNNHERMESEKPGSSDIEPELLRESKKAVSRYLKDYKSKLKSGGVAYEKKEMDRKQQQRISKSIERAVKEIKKYDTTTFEHFMNALKPFNTKNQCYGTSQNIKWTVK